ncbi:hypothetical protein [Lentzea sp. NEAU-D7]|uniref:hypothetical protein n=1 Tax=Lentzea sp. NEAU-D7 TaxID=2994667 RepID=UPI00224B4170|nr:hypothetical protein [Lentzea sp. NEAU-D7]MCX2954562.1 hypothetical protein [Lentzea sp. NEAU-D7]
MAVLAAAAACAAPALPRGQLPTSADTDHAVNRALDYPYEAVTGSYLFVNGEKYDYVSTGHDAMRDGQVRNERGEVVTVESLLTGKIPSRGVTLPAAMAGRSPVIAYGSNRAPSALQQKFSGPDFDRGWSAVPVIKATLSDFEVVHAAHYYGNGNLPATIQYAKGARSEVFITFMDDVELARMHATEGLDPDSPQSWYHYAKLSNVDVELDGGAKLGEAFVYVDNYGAVTVGGETFALAKVSGSPVSPQRSQEEVLTLTRPLVERPVSGADQGVCDVYGGIRSFVCVTYRDPCERVARTRELQSGHSTSFSVPVESAIRYEVIAGSRVPGNPRTYRGPRCESDPDAG